MLQLTKYRADVKAKVEDEFKLGGQRSAWQVHGALSTARLEFHTRKRMCKCILPSLSDGRVDNASEQQPKTAVVSVCVSGQVLANSFTGTLLACAAQQAGPTGEVAGWPLKALLAGFLVRACSVSTFTVTS